MLSLEENNIASHEEIFLWTCVPKGLPLLAHATGNDMGFCEQDSYIIKPKPNHPRTTSDERFWMTPLKILIGLSQTNCCNRSSLLCCCEGEES